MPAFIVQLEGPDYSFKDTLMNQFAFMVQSRINRKFKVHQLSSTNYDDPSSYFIREYLNGKYGDPSKTTGVSKALLYTVSRYDLVQKNLDIFNDDNAIIFLNRWTSSNFFYQCVCNENKNITKLFIDLLKYVEHLELQIPAPDVMIYLDQNINFAKELLYKRTEKKDKLESNIKFLEEIYNRYYSNPYLLDLFMKNYISEYGIKFKHVQVYKKIKHKGNIDLPGIIRFEKDNDILKPTTDYILDIMREKGFIKGGNNMNSKNKLPSIFKGSAFSILEESINEHSMDISSKYKNMKPIPGIKIPSGSSSFSMEDKSIIKKECSKPVIYAEFIGCNNFIDICARACASCYKTKLPDDIQGKYNYIIKRVKAGHDSILEHSNIMMKVTIKDDGSLDIGEIIAKFITAAKYLNIGYTSNNNSNGIHTKILHIAGSIRGYKDLYQRLVDYKIIESGIGQALFNELFSKYNLLEDIITGVFRDKEVNYLPMEQKDPCIPQETLEYINKQIKNSQNLYSEYSSFNGCYIEDGNIIKGIEKYSEVINIDNMVHEPMNFDDIIRSNTITVRFVNMSRTCTHQLVRHRNAITQQSQRYVSAENATFTIPRGNGLSYKSIKLESEEYSYSLEDVLCNAFNISRLIYSELLKNGVKKEDARSILSENTNCEEIYITFTYYNLKKFLELRTDPHAQEEIRSYATALLYALRAGCIPDQDPKPKFLYNYLESVANTLDNSKK